MRIIIVDNGASHLEPLRAICGRERTDVVPVKQLDGITPPSDAVFVLSGRHNHHKPGDRHPVIAGDRFYEAELDLIARGQHPIIGVCFGFELIAHQAGAVLMLANRPEKGIIDIFPTPEGSNWLPKYSMPAYESHRWVLPHAPPGYVSLARSADGVEAIANLSRRIVGFQFHPEHDTAGGPEIFDRVLARVTQ